MKTNLKIKRVALPIAVLIFLFAGMPAVQAARVEDFYKGKTLTFLVPNSPGGGYDTWARLLAPSFSYRWVMWLLTVDSPR